MVLDDGAVGLPLMGILVLVKPPTIAAPHTSSPRVGLLREQPEAVKLALGKSPSSA